MMPDEPNAIAPALTPDEWAKRQLPSKSWASHPFDGSPAHWYENQAPALWIEDGCIAVDNSDSEYAEQRLAPEKVMALANAALPDDDPRKITRADVELLRDGEFSADSPLLWYAVERLAAKLAALLPPE